MGALKESLKKIHRSLMQSLKRRPAGILDTDGLLGHSLSDGDLYYKGPTLQKIIPVFWGVTPLAFEN